MATKKHPPDIFVVCMATKKRPPDVFVACMAIKKRRQIVRNSLMAFVHAKTCAVFIPAGNEPGAVLATPCKG